jgi:hypothetical protein
LLVAGVSVAGRLLAAVSVDYFFVLARISDLNISW